VTVIFFFFFYSLFLLVKKKRWGEVGIKHPGAPCFCITLYSFLFQLQKLVWLADEFCVRCIILKRGFGHSSKKADIYVTFKGVGIRKQISLLCTLILHEQVYKYILSVKQHVQFIHNAS